MTKRDEKYDCSGNGRTTVLLIALIVIVVLAIAILTMISSSGAT